MTRLETICTRKLAALAGNLQTSEVSETSEVDGRCREPRQLCRTLVVEDW